MDPNFYKEYFELEKSHWWFKARRNIVASVIERYVGGSRPFDSAQGKQTIFDAGCGSGFFVRHLNQMGYRASGADMFAPAVEYGKSQGIEGLSVMHNERIEAADNTYDCVLALDVLEHLKDETGLVGEMYRTLKPGGFMLVTVPAFRFLWGLQDEVSHHYRRYTMGQLKKVFAGMRSEGRIVFSSYYNSLLFPPIAAIRVASRILGLRGRRGSDFEMNSGILNTVLFRIFNLEAYLLRLLRFPFGVSIVVVLKKH